MRSGELFVIPHHYGYVIAYTDSVVWTAETVVELHGGDLLVILSYPEDRNVVSLLTHLGVVYVPLYRFDQMVTQAHGVTEG